MRKNLLEQYDNNWEKMVDHCIVRLKRNGLRLPYKEFKEYYMDKEPLGYLFDPFFVAKCFQIQKHVRDDFDHFIVFSGKEGRGKSTLAIKAGAYLDKNFSVDNVVFTEREIVQGIKTLPRYSYILIDEGGINLYSREAMSKVNITLTKLFMIMRQDNLILAICIPNFHLLDTYVKDHRCDILLQVINRGKYKCFIERGIRRVSQFGRKLKEIEGIKVASGTTWYGDFNKDLPKNFDEEEYLRRKKEHRDRFLKEIEDAGDVSDYITIGKLAGKISLDRKTIRKRIDEGEIEGKKIGHQWYVTKDGADDFTKKFKMPKT